MAPSRAVFEERWLPGQEVRREDMTGLETTRRKKERKKEKKKKQEKEKEKENEEKKDDIGVHVMNRGRGRESTIISASDFFSPRFKSLGILSGELLRPEVLPRLRLHHSQNPIAGRGTLHCLFDPCTLTSIKKACCRHFMSRPEKKRKKI